MNELLSPTSVAQTVQPYQMDAQGLLAQAQRAEIDSSERYATGADLAKIISTKIKAAEEARTALVKPLNDHVKWINGQFKPTTETLEQAKQLLMAKMTRFAQLQEQEQARLRAEARAREEAEALERAKALEAEGKRELADAVLDTAASLPEAPLRSTPTRGNLGSTASTKKVWKLRIVDPAALPRWCVETVTPGEVVSLQSAAVPLLSLNVKAINAAAREALEAGKPPLIPGLEFFQEVAVAIR